MASPARVISVEARPGPLTIDLTFAAVLVVDMQNDFGAQGGMFERAGIDISVIQRAVDPTRCVIAAARNAGVRIVYLKMAHLADMSDAGGPNSPHGRRHWRLSVGEPASSPDGRPSRILIDDTWNTEILPELVPLPGDTVVRKHRYSGFFETGGCGPSVCGRLS